MEAGGELAGLEHCGSLVVSRAVLESEQQLRSVLNSRCPAITADILKVLDANRKNKDDVAAEAVKEEVMVEPDINHLQWEENDSLGSHFLAIANMQT